MTKPEEWTPNAAFQATRIFVSSKPAVVRRFMEIILLERVRDDIRETKKLNVHLFSALKKALYKPAAWFKGFLFPLVESGTCTLREAHIISAVLARVSIPVLHSGAAIKGLCDIAALESSAGTEGGGATNVFIKTLLGMICVALMLSSTSPTNEPSSAPYRKEVRPTIPGYRLPGLPLPAVSQRQPGGHQRGRPGQHARRAGIGPG